MNTEVGYFPVGPNLIIYYTIVTLIGSLFFIYLRKDKFSILLFLMFFNGVSSYWGEFIDTLFKFLILAFTILIYLDTKNTSYINLTSSIIFVLFSMTFWFSIYSNQNPFLFAFSQYTKFLIPFLIFTSLINHLFDKQMLSYYLRLVVNLILLQVLFSITKFFTIGFSESVVGSIAFLGGSSASILPILGYLIIYFLNDGKIKKSEIIQIASMLVISIMSFKRIIWFLMPAVILILNSRFFFSRYLKYAIIVIPIILYVGIRLNPTLNKEKKIWGSFDLAYAIDYAQDYYGMEDNKHGIDKSVGRFGGNIVMIKYILANIDNYKTWFGYGPKVIYGMVYEDYAKTKWPWGISDKGSLTGAARFFISYGLLGIIFYLSLIIYFFNYCTSKNFTIIMVIFFLFEFFFYLDSLFYFPLITSFLLISSFLTESDHSNYKSTISKYKLNVFTY